MKDTLKRALWRMLRFLLWHISPPESFPGMKARHEEEITIFQKHCSHKEVSFRFPPFIICANCQKVLRKATQEECEGERENSLKQLNEQLEGYGIKLGVPALMTAEEIRKAEE